MHLPPDSILDQGMTNIEPISETPLALQNPLALYYAIVSECSRAAASQGGYSLQRNFVMLELYLAP